MSFFVVQIDESILEKAPVEMVQRYEQAIKELTDMDTDSKLRGIKVLQDCASALEKALKHHNTVLALRKKTEELSSIDQILKTQIETMRDEKDRLKDKLEAQTATEKEILLLEQQIAEKLAEIKEVQKKIEENNQKIIRSENRLKLMQKEEPVLLGEEGAVKLKETKQL
eukprot:Platyproteum_vivax@DN9803_c0_g1_i1.p1